MDWRVKECEYRRLQPDPEEISGDEVIEPGLDEFDSIGSQDTAEAVIKTYRVAKRTSLFEVDIRFSFRVTEDELNDEEFDVEENIKNTIAVQGSHLVEGYLKSMNYPPIPSLLADQSFFSPESSHEDGD